MAPQTEQPDAAADFQVETEALAALDLRILRLTRERRRLQESFDAVAASIDRALAKNELPLVLLAELSRIDAEIAAIERQLEFELEQGIERFS